jgi:citrate lyase beta subunit
MQLCLITDKIDFALEAERAGVARIMLDLERIGKEQRQRGRELFISDHRIESVPGIKAVLKEASLVIRINPLTDRSKEEIESVVEAGADFIMLPYFHTLHEVRDFLLLVRGRAKTILLVETKSSLAALPEIVSEKGVDEVHIGLNDLSISLGHRTLFGPLCSGVIDCASALLRQSRIPFGFGGIARISHVGLPVDPQAMIAEQVRLGASVGWLGRTFRGTKQPASRGISRGDQPNPQDHRSMEVGPRRSICSKQGSACQRGSKMGSESRSALTKVIPTGRPRVDASCRGSGILTFLN